VPRRDRVQDEEDEQLRRALAESQREADEQAMKTRSEQDDPITRAQIREAERLSAEEEELRKRKLEDENAASLFDDTPAPAQPQPTGYNQGYQQQPAVDWFGNPLQQQPQNTGFLNNQYAQPQQTGYQNGFPNGFQGAAQPTGFDQFGQTPFLQQQNTLQPQQTAFQNNNPYGLQPNGSFFGAQPAQQQLQQQQVPQLQQQPLPTGSNNPWASQPQAAEQIKPLPTGSNNPFAQKTQQPSPSPFARTQTQPSLGTLYESQPTAQFTQPSQPNPILNYQAPQPSFQQQQQQQKPLNPHHEKLNALLSTGEGIDTFGNVGDLRIPSQHTAPGTFVNSSGQGLERLRVAQTGTNPFFSQQATGFGQQVPAQTGPATGFGGGYGQQNNNAFGARPVGQQSGSLIDL
jgi:epsin